VSRAGGYGTRMSRQGTNLSKEEGRADRAAPSHRFLGARRVVRQVRLIVVETGSTGALAAAAADDGEQTVLVAQNDGEPRLEFAARVVRRILSLERDEREVSKTLLLLAPQFDDDVTVARLLIARALITHAVALRGGPAEVVIDLGRDSRGVLPNGFPALVDALVGEAGRGAATIGVELVRGPTSATLSQPAARG
jgi:hypothetical protein